MPLLSKYLTHARLSRISRHLGSQILDVGCGYGELLDFLPPSVNRIVLLDRSAERQQVVERRMAGKHLAATFLTAEIDREDVDLDLAPFDTVVMAALLEHLKRPEVALKNLRRLMKNGGTLVLTTPTPSGGKLHWLGSHLGLVYAEAAQEHVQFYDYPLLKPLLESSGFHIHHYRKFFFRLNQLLIATIVQR
jgi:2-polyprenyl-3-methyl-5-hydroxy-6-metoxy-1,4-benzoquinol methylase